MPKTDTAYICSKCSAHYSKWTGRCLNCGQWNTLIEKEKEFSPNKISIGKIKKITNIVLKEYSMSRIKTDIEEFDRVLGGGIVADSVILLSGDPGIGKSTLSLMICEKIALKNKKVLYISGEESVSQINSRARRINVKNKNLKLLNENCIENILATEEDFSPDAVIIDSIQVLYSKNLPGAAGSVSQVRSIAEKILEQAKKKHFACILIGHITKNRDLAGPMTLMHLVDTVLYLEGDRYQNMRILRSIKNRFGSADEIGIFEMQEKGLKEVMSPSKAFLGERKETSGSVISATVEGSRPFLIEIQALTSYTNFKFPTRTSSGFDYNRMQLMIAVLKKHTKLKLDTQDIYINVIGGFKIIEPANDLAALAAIASSFTSAPPIKKCVFVGEVGLTGEIRGVRQIEKRIKESEKLGFENVILPKLEEKIKTKINLIEVQKISEALRLGLVSK